ncbi:MAG: zinc ribbon domain-containing protein, partial [Clostridia bacterium]|nr:zinc ribbon domain-containing protein [Clostridia bacterium]
MSLIRCPECGKEISSTLESCIHCGYKFNLQSVAIQPPVPEDTRLSPELEKAEQHAAEDIAYYKKASRIKNCALVLSSCMLIIGVILFFVWWKAYDSLEQLLYYRTFHSAIYSMIILAAIFFTADFFYNFFKEGYGPLRGAKRLESEKADYAGYVKA